MIIHDHSIHIAVYLIKRFDQTVTIISFSWVGFYRVDLDLSDDAMFDRIDPVFLGKTCF